MMAAVALMINPFCGRDSQLNIWIGKTEKSSIGLEGSVVMYSIAPMTINGAVSPIALEIARMTPVTIPPADAGNTWNQVVCHLVAPSAKDASRIVFGTAFNASRVATIMIGRINNASVRLPESKSVFLAIFFEIDT